MTAAPKMPQKLRFMNLLVEAASARTETVVKAARRRPKLRSITAAGQLREEGARAHTCSGVCTFHASGVSHICLNLEETSVKSGSPAASQLERVRAEKNKKHLNASV